MYNSFVTPWTAALQAPLSMGFPKQEYWSGLPLPFPGDLPNPGIKPVSLAFASRLSLSHQGSPAFKIILCKSKQHLVFFTSLSFFPPAHSLTWKLIPHFWKLVKFFFFSKCLKWNLKHNWSWLVSAVCILTGDLVNIQKLIYFWQWDPNSPLGSFHRSWLIF